MPCEKCGRTSLFERLFFSRDRETGQFLCSFCSPSCDRESRAQGGSLSDLADSLLTGRIFTILIFVVFISMAVGIQVSTDLFNGPDPAEIGDLEYDEEYRVFGIINSSRERVIYHDENGSQVKHDLILVQGNASIRIHFSPSTDIYQFGPNANGSLEYRPGDEVYVVGKVAYRNYNWTLDADRLMDEERNTSSLVSVLLYVGAFFLLFPGAGGIFQLGSMLNFPGKNTLLERTVPGSKTAVTEDGKPFAARLKQELAKLKTLEKGGKVFLNWEEQGFAFQLMIMRLFILFSLLFISDQVLNHFIEELPKLFSFLVWRLFGGSMVLLILGSCLASLATTHWKIVLGKEGLLVFRETREPLHILWEDIHFALPDCSGGGKISIALPNYPHLESLFLYPGVFREVDLAWLEWLGEQKAGVADSGNLVKGAV